MLGNETVYIATSNKLNIIIAHRTRRDKNNYEWLEKKFQILLKCNINALEFFKITNMWQKVKRWLYKTTAPYQKKKKT